MHWHLQNSTYTGDQASLLLHNRLNHGTHETWLEDTQGRALAIITNGTRAMVILHTTATTHHLTDPLAPGHSTGFTLSNGQVDSYADRDTVDFATATRAIAHFIDHDRWPDDVTAEED